MPNGVSALYCPRCRSDRESGREHFAFRWTPRTQAASSPFANTSTERNPVPSSSASTERHYSVVLGPLSVIKQSLFSAISDETLRSENQNGHICL